MNEQTPITPRSTTAAFDLNTLDRASDETLTELIAKAQALLTSRENERKRDAIARIKELAKAHGLDVTLEPRNTKRGRRQRRSKNDATPHTTKRTGNESDL